MKILITGGHLTPALAIIEYLREKNRDQIIFVGRKHSIEGSNTLSQEYIQIQKKNIQFIQMTTGRLQRSFTKFTLISIIKIPYGFIQSLQILIKEKPHCILSFGGYVAVPLCIVGWILGIPIFTHEQTGELGLSNKIISYFAKKVFLSWPNKKYEKNKSKFMVTGNPIRKAIFTVNSEGFPKEFADEQVPLIYITGGSQGSESINKTVLKCLPRLLTKVKIIHQIGQNVGIKSEIDKIVNSLEISLRKRYISYEYVDSKKIGWILKNSNVVIGRSGANTVSELIALGKKALLIPLPWAGNNEQVNNAERMKKIGLAEVLEQKNVDETVLYDKIMYMLQVKNNSQTDIPASYKNNAEEKIINCIVTNLQK